MWPRNDTECAGAGDARPVLPAAFAPRCGACPHSLCGIPGILFLLPSSLALFGLQPAGALSCGPQPFPGFVAFTFCEAFLEFPVGAPEAVQFRFGLFPLLRCFGCDGLLALRRDYIQRACLAFPGTRLVREADLAVWVSAFVHGIGARAACMCRDCSEDDD